MKTEKEVSPMKKSAPLNDKVEEEPPEVSKYIKKYQELKEQWNQAVRRYTDAFHAMLFAMIKETDRPLLGMFLLSIDFLQMTAFCFIDFEWGPWGKVYGLLLEGLQVERLVVKETSFLVHTIMVSISLVLIVTMLGLAGYNLRAFLNKNFSAVWPLRLLRKLTGLLVGVLYLPIIGFLFSILTCSGPDTPCYDPIHVAFLVPSFLAILLFVPFTLMMAVSYFYPDPRSPNILARPSARLELLEILVKTMLAALFIFLSDYPGLRSFFTLFCNCAITAYLWMYLPYYKNKTNLIRTNLTLHTMWGSLLSIIVSFAPEAGHVTFIVYLVTSIPMAVASYYAVNWRIQRATSRGQCFMYEARGYEEMWTQQEQKDTRLWHPSQVEVATRFLIEDESPEALDVADAIFVKGVQLFPNSASLMVTAALFYARYKKNWSMAQLYLKKAALNHPKFDLQFTIYMIEIEEKTKASSSNKMGTRVLDAVERVEYRQLLKTATQQHRDAKMHMANFWQALYSGSVNTSTLFDLASKIEKSDKAAEDAYTTLNSRFPNSHRVLTQYARFLDEIHHNLDESDKVLAQIINTTKGPSKDLRADLTRKRRTKKELKAHREYSRQVHGIQSSANNRMVRITKGVIIVLFAIAVAKALWTLQTCTEVRQSVTVVQGAGLCRQRVLDLCTSSRLLQSYALNNDTGSMDTVRNQGLQEVTDLATTYRDLLDFSTGGRLHAKAFDLWVGKRNAYNVFHNQDLKTNRTDVYATLEEATDLFVRHSRKIFALNESSFVSSGGDMSPVQADAHWRFVMDNGPVALSELYRELGGLYNAEEHETVQNYLYFQLGMLGGTFIVLSVAGRGLFYPTIEKARRNRELVLQAFLQIPPEITERLFDEYYVQYNVQSKEELNEIQKKVVEDAEGEGKECDPDQESEDDDDSPDEGKSKAAAQGSSQTRYTILVKQSITALLIVAAAYTIAVLLDLYFVNYTMLNSRRAELLGSVDYISERYEFTTNELTLSDPWLDPFPTSQLKDYEQRYENATDDERETMSFAIGAPTLSGLLLLDVGRMQDDLTQLLYFAFLIQNDNLFAKFQSAFNELQFQGNTKSLGQRLSDYYEYLNIFAISGSSLQKSDLTDDVLSAANDVRTGLQLMRDLWLNQYASDLNTLSNVAYIALTLCSFVLISVYRCMLRPIMYHLMYAENERTAKLLLMIPVDVVPQLEVLQQLLHISGKARVKGQDEKGGIRESALNVHRSSNVHKEMADMKRRMSSGSKQPFKHVIPGSDAFIDSPQESSSSGYNSPRSPACINN